MVQESRETAWNSLPSNLYPDPCKCGDPDQPPKVEEIRHHGFHIMTWPITSFEARIIIWCNSPDFLNKELS
jgi:hypothetical protein